MKPQKIHKLLGNHSQGTYIDIGAYDGIKVNNTKYFEDVGWTGIAVEPHPTSFAKLESNRNCIKENIVIADHDGVSEFNWSDDAPMTSRVDMSGRKGKIHDMKNVVKQQLPCMTLNSLCEKHNITQVDFLKIDAEGYDCHIINSIDFKKLHISFILFEMWGHHEEVCYKLAIEKLINNSYLEVTKDYDIAFADRFNRYFLKS